MTTWIKAGLAAGSNRVRCGVYGVFDGLGYEATVSCEKKKKRRRTWRYAYTAQSTSPCSQDDMKDRMGVSHGTWLFEEGGNVMVSAVNTMLPIRA